MPSQLTTCYRQHQGKWARPARMPANSKLHGTAPSCLGLAASRLLLRGMARARGAVPRAPRLRCTARLVRLPLLRMEACSSRADQARCSQTAEERPRMGKQHTSSPCCATAGRLWWRARQPAQPGAGLRTRAPRPHPAGAGGHGEMDWWAREWRGRRRWRQHLIKGLPFSPSKARRTGGASQGPMQAAEWLRATGCCTLSHPAMGACSLLLD